MRWISSGAVLSAVCLCNAAVDPPAPSDFKSRTDAYMKARKLASRDVASLPSKAEPEQIEQHRRSLADAIRRHRVGARQGDVLTPVVQRYLIDLVRSEMAGTDGRSARKSAKQGNPVEETPSVPVQVAVNAVYPEEASTSTVPATLLQRLPKLPKQLDFRFVGRHLVLRDAEAGLIVDVVPNAMPR
jgi:hypothetical protein